MLCMLKTDYQKFLNENYKKCKCVKLLYTFELYLFKIFDLCIYIGFKIINDKDESGNNNKFCIRQVKWANTQEL